MDEPPPKEDVANRRRRIETELLADSRDIGGTGLDAGYGARRIAGEKFVDRKRDRHDRPYDRQTRSEPPHYSAPRPNARSSALAARSIQVALTSSGHTGCG